MHDPALQGALPSQSTGRSMACDAPLKTEKRGLGDISLARSCPTWACMWPGGKRSAAFWLAWLASQTLLQAAAAVQVCHPRGVAGASEPAPSGLPSMPRSTCVRQRRSIVGTAGPGFVRTCSVACCILARKVLYLTTEL